MGIRGDEMIFLAGMIPGTSYQVLVGIKVNVQEHSSLPAVPRTRAISTFDGDKIQI